MCVDEMTGLEGIERNNKHNQRKCRGCVYHSKNPAWCNYREITGRSRLVDGGKLFPDGGCRLYTRGSRNGNTASPWRKGFPLVETRKEYEEKSGRSRFANKTETDFRQIEDLYNKGLSDQRIADTLGFNVKTIYRWRHRHGVQSNYFKDRKKASHEGC